MEELEPVPAQVTFDEVGFAESLIWYRRAVAEGDKSDTDMYTGFRVKVSDIGYAGGMQQVVCNHHGQPISVLVSVTSDTPWTSDRQAYIVLTRHPDDPAAWIAQQRTYHGDPRTEPVAMWVNRTD